MNDLHTFDPSTATWEEVSPIGDLPAARSYFCSAAIDGKLYVHGSSQFSADLWVLDTSTVSWQKLSPMGDIPEATYDHSCAALGGSLYFYGNNLRKYDVAANVWSIVDVPGSKPDVVVFSLDRMVAVRGVIWLVRQQTDWELWVFSPEQSTWKDASMQVRGASPPSRSLHGCTEADGRIYISGGSQETNTRYGSDLWMLDAAEGYLGPEAVLVWTELSAGSLLGSAPVQRMGAGLAVLWGRMYIFGGLSPNDRDGRRLPYCPTALLCCLLFLMNSERFNALVTPPPKQQHRGDRSTGSYPLQTLTHF